VDKDSGLVHHLKVTAVNVHDVAKMPELLNGEEEKVHCDSRYLGAEKRDNDIISVMSRTRKSSTSSIGDRHKSKNLVPAANGMQKKRNTRNPQYGQKWSMFLGQSKDYSAIEKPGTMVCESRRQNCI
jgi:IS5 family transposase